LQKVSVDNPDFFRFYSITGYNYSIDSLALDDFQIRLENCLYESIPKELCSFLVEDIHNCSWGGILLADAMFVSLEKEGVIEVSRNPESDGYAFDLLEGFHWDVILNTICFSFDRTYLDLFKIRVLQLIDQI
tara:strand:+ start:460 stop:855 length:396 start_codon:yes stop_codon:yes gene_type:complete